MKRIKQYFTTLRWVAIASFVGGVLLLTNPTLSHAQCHTPAAGEHVVYYSATNPPSGCSTAYIDASAFQYTGSPTLCGKVYQILASGSYPPEGAVIDARGLANSVTSTWSCNAWETPWCEGTSATNQCSLANGTYKNVPSVLLLPAGVITTSYTWVLPDRTLVIGQGAGALASGTISQWGTILTASGTFAGPASGYNPVAPVAMIQFGDPGINTCGATATQAGTGICFHISIEGLTLNAASQAVNGILNMDSQELSYAKRINLINFSGSKNTGNAVAVGLQIGAPCNGVGTCAYYAQAQNSGPYEQIYYSGAGTCAQIFGAGIRGFHGITCAGTSSPAAGILLDSSSNTLEDVTLSGFTDGIKIGSQSTTGPIQSEAWNDALINITGSAGTNLIHICSATSGSCVPTSAPVPQDLNIMGATSSAGTTIQDDITTTKLTDPSVALYALGEPASSGTGNSRFTTSPNWPTWFIGTSQSVTGLACPADGSIYTSSGTSSMGTIWGCVAGSWTLIE